MSALATSAASLTDGATLFIGGSWRAAESGYERFDPAHLDRSTGRFAAASPQHVHAAYAAASVAQPGWAATPAPQRSEILRRAALLLEERTDEAARRLTADMGKAVRDASAEVARSVAILRYFAGELLQPSGETYPSADPATMLLTVEQALGVVCAITPWNFPFAIPTWKLAPALGFGNAVVWKPAEPASGSAVLLTEVLIAAGIPDGVLNLITGQGRALSAELTGDPALAALTFTGSNGVGVRLRQAVADRNVKVQLELGGKNPAIVLADADLEDAASQVVRGAMLSTGQRCTATSRVYVERTVEPRFRELVKQRVTALVVGDPYVYAGQTPLLVSEWGGFGFPMYGGEAALDSRTEQIRAFKRELTDRAFAGDLYTQATSIEDETNGLIDPTTGALLVPPGILASPPRR